MSVKCTKFSAWNWSPAMLIGISPNKKFCETELTGEFSFPCPECKKRCLHE